MTRAEAYSSGWHEGRRWAEHDIRDGESDTSEREWDAIGYGFSDSGRAYRLGITRGYRDTMARYEAGTLTWEMFEHAPMRGEKR